MLALWATGALLAGLRLVRRGPSVGRVAGLLACAGLAVLTHPRGYFLPPFAAIAVLVSLWRFRPGWRWAAAAGAAVVTATSPSVSSAPSSSTSST